MTDNKNIFSQRVDAVYAPLVREDYGHRVGDVIGRAVTGPTLVINAEWEQLMRDNPDYILGVDSD